MEALNLFEIFYGIKKKNDPTQSSIHLMAKPSGPACNMRCTYCFYLEKQALFAGSSDHRMGDDALEGYVKQCAASSSLTSRIVRIRSQLQAAQTA